MALLLMRLRPHLWRFLFVAGVLICSADIVQSSSDQDGSRTAAANRRLWEAATKNDVQEVRRALDGGEDGANMNARDLSSGQTPLMAAVLRGHTETVQFLLQRGADAVSIGEKDGYTPAHGAGFQGRADIMKLLYDHGVDVKSITHDDGYAPLHRACWGREQRHADTVELLLDLGVDPKMEATNGRTCADMTNNPATQKVLQEYGARTRDL